MDKPRTIFGYEVKQSFTIGGRDIVLGVNEQMENPYMVCTVGYNNLFHAPWPEQGIGSKDYLEITEAFAGRITAEIERLREDRSIEQALGAAGELLRTEDCIPDSKGMEYNGQVLVVDPSRMAPEYRSIGNQLIYATHGSGCRPHSYGTTVFAKNICTGRSEQWSRAAILGVIRPERMPEWAKERLHDIRQEIATQRENRRSELER